MPNHRIRYTPRDGWDGAESLQTVTLGTVPSFERYSITPISDRGTIITPGRNYRSFTIDAWLLYEFELRNIEEDSDLYRGLTAFLSEAEAGVEFEFAYDDTKTGATETDGFTWQPNDVFFALKSGGGAAFADGDRIYYRANWNRSVFAWFVNTDFTGDSVNFSPEVIGEQTDPGDLVRHLDFVPKAILVGQTFRKRRAFESASETWDLTLRFREVL